MKYWEDIFCLDMFSGAAGSGKGIEMAGIPVRYAANHWDYALELSAANMPRTEHFLADLLDENAKLYKRADRLPPAALLWASPSCTNHSPAKAKKAYLRQQSLFGVEDPVYFRMLLPEELKRAQTFPDDYRLFGPIRNQVKAIGNAVTTSVAQMIVERLIPVLEGK